MYDRPAVNEHEALAREALIRLVAEMLDERQSFFEGAAKVLRLKSAVGGVSDRDPDFDAFAVIVSETDHLPLKEQRHLWSTKVLADLQPEYERTEAWAQNFAPAACRRLLERFG